MTGARTRRQVGVTRKLLPLSVYALRAWRQLLGAFGSALAAAVVGLMTPWPLKIVIDHVLGSQRRPDWLVRICEILPFAASRSGLLAWSAAAIVVIFSVGWLCTLVAAYVGVGLRQRITYELASDLFERLQRFSLRLRGQRGTGDLLRRTLIDTECVATLVVSVVLPVAVSALTVVGAFGVLWATSPRLLLCAALVVPVLALALRHYTPLMMQRSLAQQDLEGALYNDVERTLSAMPVVQAFTAEGRSLDRFRESTGRLLTATMRTTDVQLRFVVVVGSAMAVATALILYVGGTGVLRGELTVGDVVLFLAYLRALYAPIDTLITSNESVQAAVGSARRVMEVMETPLDVADRPGARALRRVRGSVVFEGVQFGYEPDRPVLVDVSLAAEPGQTVALVGPSGAGKTTLVSLLPRFFDPVRGRVLIDGHDVRDVSLSSLRRQISIVLQEPFLFPISIADNVAYGCPTADRARVERAARAANAHEFIVDLPQGYDTVVGERGATLSGGQRQRISIARALLKDAPLLVLDEPTSALDTESESLLLEALERLMAGRTTLIIAHRLSTIRHADQILVMDKGRIVQTGTHDRLVAADGLYQRLHGASV